MSPASVTGELNFQDLSRFEEILKPPFRRALNVGRVDLLPPPDSDNPDEAPLREALVKGSAIFDTAGHRLIMPLIHQGRALGLLSAHGVEVDQLPAAVHPFLASLAEAALDLVRMRLAVETDPVTGLANGAALDQALTNAISRLAPAAARGRLALDDESESLGLCLLAFEPQGLEVWQERHGRLPAEALLAELAHQGQEAAPGAMIAAREGATFFLLLPGRSQAALKTALSLERAAAEMGRDNGRDDPWPGILNLGAARLPARGEGPAAEAAALLKARAKRALAAAGTVGIEGVLFFDKIAEQAGRIREVMPLDRILINLGRVHGLAEGERFAVVQPGDEQTQSKAEVVVTKLGEEESLAEVVQLSQPTSLLRPGDALHRLGMEEPVRGPAAREKTVSLAGVKLPVLLDEASGAMDHRSLLSVFQALAEKDEPFAAVLMRVEGLEGMAEVCGRLGAETLMSGLATALRESFGAEAFLGRHSPDTMVMLLPGADQEEAMDGALAALAASQGQGGRPVRAGVAAHSEEGFNPAHTLENAAKALVHAGFLEPYSAVVFDAVSLNISGDDLFNQGRISEAIAEYEKALVIDAQETNVLNSLGVCYGHLGQMELARENFEKAVEAAPDDHMAHYNLGLALMSLGRPAQAQPSLERSLELSPEHADALFQLGRLAQEAGSSKKSLEYYRRAAAQPGCKKAVHRSLGEVLATEGMASEAEEAFKAAAKANPHDAASLCGLAVLYLDRGANLEIALSLVRRAHRMDPMSLRYIRVLARAMLARERHPEALWLLRDAIEEHPQEPQLHLLLGRAEEAMGDQDAAREQYGRALSLEPNLEEARAALARLGESG